MMEQQKLTEVGLSDLADLLEDCNLLDTLDLGETLLHYADHVEHGRIVVATTFSGRAACFAIGS
jgi:hypothetical protein